LAGSFPAGLSSAWSFGSSLFTFIFPMSLFIIVAAILYLQCSRPHRAPVSWHLALTPDQRNSPPPGSSGPVQGETAPDRPEAAE
jgi:hypothetical protein